MSLPLELPEVETIRRDLDRELSGRKVKDVDITSQTLVVSSVNQKSFASQISGRKIVTVRRLGLDILVDFDNASILVFRLGPSARMIRHTAKDSREKGTELTIIFTVGGQVSLIDTEKKSEVCLVSGGDEGLFVEFPHLADLGLDAIAEPSSWTTFAGDVLGREEELKVLLADDSVVAGLGGIYSDEILFHAGLRHNRQGSSLSIQEVRRLYRALVETVHEAVKYRGTSLEDRPFIDVYGKSGEFSQHLAVYGRDGELSPRSRAPIQRVKYKGSWTYYCDTQV